MCGEGREVLRVGVRVCRDVSEKLRVGEEVDDIRLSLRTGDQNSIILTQLKVTAMNG